MKKVTTLPLPSCPIFEAIEIALIMMRNFALFQEACKYYNIKSNINFYEKDNQCVASTKDVKIYLPKDCQKSNITRSSLDKIFIFILCKIACSYRNEELNNSQLVFELNDLVKYKIAKSIRVARQEIYLFNRYLSEITIVVAPDSPYYSNNNDLRHLFNQIDISNGKVIVSLNNNYDWGTLLKGCLHISEEAFTLSPQSFRVHQVVFKMIAKKRRKDDFLLPLGEVLTFAGIFHEKSNPIRWINKINKTSDEINKCKSLNVSFSLIVRGGNTSRYVIANSYILAHNYRRKNTLKNNSDSYGYIYKFYDKNKELLYIGKTKNIQRRISQHFNNGHLPQECYQKIDCIEYAQLPTYTDAGILERYYIALLSPKYNIQYVNDGVPHCIVKPPQMNWEKLNFKT